MSDGTERHRQDAVDGIEYSIYIWDVGYVNILKSGIVNSDYWYIYYIQFVIIKVAIDMSQYVGSSHSMLVMAV